jgi:hypothetical protein
MPFKRPKASNIKRLEKMRCMSRHAERYNLVLLTVSLKIGRVVAFVAIKDQKTIGTS